MISSNTTCTFAFSRAWIWSAIGQDGQTVIPYPVQQPPVIPSTVHLIVNGEEYFAPDITVGAFGVTWANPAFQLEQTDKVVLRYT